MNQRLDRLDGCHLIIKQPVLRLVELCEQKLKRKLFIVFGYRSVQEQLLQYQKGRAFNRETGVWEVADEKALVTRALPGQSAHNVVTTSGSPASMAVDLIPLKSDGSADWQVSNHFWDQLYELSWDVGLDPLGDPIGSYLAGDMGHFEEPGFRLKMDGLGVIFPVSSVQSGAI